MSLSETTRQSIERLVGLYPERRTALLPALKAAQAEVGYLPPETIAETADLVGVPHSAALELAVFYTMLHTEPGPATRVVVCAQLPCALRGAEGLIRELRSALATRIAEGSLEIERSGQHAITIARSVADIRAAKGTGKTAVVLHFQGADPIEDELDFIDIFHAVGLRVMQVTYNLRNRLGDGCFEPIRSLDVLTANIDDGRLGTDRVTAQRDALEHPVRLDFDQLAVFEGPRFRLVGVDGHVLGARPLGYEAPFGTGWEACATPAAQTRGFDLLDNGVRRHLGQRPSPTYVAVLGAILLQAD